MTEQSHPGYPTSPCTASYVAVGRDCTVQFPVADLLTKDPGLTLVRASLSAGAHLGEVGGGPTTYDGTGTSCSIGFDGQAPTCTAVATPGEYGFTLECPVRAGVRTVELYCHAPGPALSVDVELTETVCDTPQQMCAL